MVNPAHFFVPRKRLWLNGEFVHIVVHRRKITHHSLASLLHVSGSSVHAWTAQKRRIPRVKLEALAKILNVPAKYLILPELTNV